MKLWRPPSVALMDSSTRLAGFLPVLLLFFLGACTPAAVLEAPDGDLVNAEGGISIPRGLADPRGGFGYVTDLQGLIHLLDLENGRDLAQSDFPAQPLALHGESLIAWSPVPDQPPAIRLLSLSQEGSRLLAGWETRLELPAWVEFDSPEPGRFSIDALLEVGRLSVTWQARSTYSGGAPPSTAVAGAQDRSAGETVQLNPQTGKIERASEAVPALTPSPGPPVLPAGYSIVPYRRDGNWATHPWQIAGGEAYLVRESGKPGILLVRREAGGEQRSRLSDDPLADAALAGAGELVLIYEPGTLDLAWQVYSAETGDLVAELPYEPGTEDVAVLDGRVLYLVVEEGSGSRAESLHCRSLESGQEKWTLSLGAQELRSPPPLRP